MAKTYHAERLKRYPRDKNVYHDHDNWPELNPLHDTENQSHSEGAWFESSNFNATRQNPTGSPLSSTRRNGLQPSKTPGGVEHQSRNHGSSSSGHGAYIGARI